MTAEIDLVSISSNVRMSLRSECAARSRAESSEEVEVLDELRRGREGTDQHRAYNELFSTPLN